MTKWNDQLNRVTTLAWLHCERWLIARAAQIKEALRRCKYLFVTDPRRSKPLRLSLGILAPRSLWQSVLGSHIRPGPPSICR